MWARAQRRKREDRPGDIKRLRLHRARTWVTRWSPNRSSRNLMLTQWGATLVINLKGGIGRGTLSLGVTPPAPWRCGLPLVSIQFQISMSGSRELNVRGPPGNEACVCRWANGLCLLYMTICIDGHICDTERPQSTCILHTCRQSMCASAMYVPLALT